MLVSRGKILCVLGPILNKNKNTIVNRQQVLYLAFVTAGWCVWDCCVMAFAYCKENTRSNKLTLKLQENDGKMFNKDQPALQKRVTKAKVTYTN